MEELNWAEGVSFDELKQGYEDALVELGWAQEAARDYWEAWREAHKQDEQAARARIEALALAALWIEENWEASRHFTDDVVRDTLVGRELVLLADRLRAEAEEKENDQG